MEQGRANSSAKWQQHRRQLEVRTQDVLISQQRQFRLAQALREGNHARALEVLQAGASVDLPLMLEGPNAVPGVERFMDPLLDGMRSATLLGLFAATADEQAIKWLLSHGANPAQPFADNRDAAWICMMASNDTLHEVLMNLGCRPNLRLSTPPNTTRLQAATLLSRPAVVDTILARGGKPNATDKDGSTALHLNFKMDPYTHRDMEIARLLLASGANPNAEDLNGMPAAAFAHSEEAMSVLQGHELNASVRLAAEQIQAKREAELEAAVDQVPGEDGPTPDPAHDPADPGLPQIKAPPKKMKAKPIINRL